MQFLKITIENQPYLGRYALFYWPSWLPLRIVVAMPIAVLTNLTFIPNSSGGTSRTEFPLLPCLPGDMAVYFSCTQVIFLHRMLPSYVSMYNVPWSEELITEVEISLGTAFPHIIIFPADEIILPSLWITSEQILTATVNYFDFFNGFHQFGHAKRICFTVWD